MWAKTLLLQLGSLFALLSPQVTGPADLSSVLSEKISKKITIAPALDYSQTKEVASLAKIPRYLVYNSVNGHVYSSKNPTEKVAPASFTKLLTTQVATDIQLENRLLQSTPTSINKIPTTLGLKPFEQFTIEDLIRGSIATSANDAAATLAESTILPYGYKLDKFIELMNEKASLIGMTSSHFTNPEGYDDQNQYSTLEDLSKLVYNVEQNYSYIQHAGLSNREDIQVSATHGYYYLLNWNGLLGVYPGVYGLKIAYTENAGYSSIVTYNRDNLFLVAIVSGANSIPERDLAAAALLDEALISEHQKPIRLTKRNIQPHYNEWTKLINQVKNELKTRELSGSKAN